MPKDYINPVQAGLMRAFKDKVPTDQEVDMQNMDDAQAKALAAQAAQLAQAKDMADQEDKGFGSLWGFGPSKQQKAAPQVDLDALTPEQIKAYFEQKNANSAKKN